MTWLQRKKSAVNQCLTTATDGKNYRVAHYNLDAILAIGYRVRTPRGMQFRRWTNTVLTSTCIKVSCSNSLEDGAMNKSSKFSLEVRERAVRLMQRHRGE